jgi:hypothetical protein
VRRVGRGRGDLLETLLDDALGGDTGVVDTWDPKSHIAFHAIPASESVLDGTGEGVAKMEGTGDVGWRDDHDELHVLVGGLGLRKVWLVEA